MDKKTLHKYGVLYFTGRITLYKVCEKTGISPSKVSNLMHTLFDDKTFDMAECNRIREERVGIKTKQIIPESNKISTQERKTSFSHNEDDYGAFGGWMESVERKSLVNAGKMVSNKLSALGNKIINLKNKTK